MGSLWVWGKLVPPMPGLPQGMICLWGFAAILGAFVACAAIAVERLLW